MQQGLSIWQTAFHALNRLFCQANESCEYLVDSMPVEVCHRVRSYRCRLLTGKKFIGFCKAKKSFYYGFKTQPQDIPLSFLLPQHLLQILQR